MASKTNQPLLRIVLSAWSKRSTPSVFHAATGVSATNALIRFRRKANALSVCSRPHRLLRLIVRDYIRKLKYYNCNEN